MTGNPHSPEIALMAASAEDRLRNARALYRSHHPVTEKVDRRIWRALVSARIRELRALRAAVVALDLLGRIN